MVITLFALLAVLVLVILMGRLLPRISLVLAIPSVYLAVVLWLESNAPFAHEESIAIGVAMVQVLLKAAAVFFALVAIYFTVNGINILRRSRAAASHEKPAAAACPVCGQPVPAGQVQCAGCIAGSPPRQSEGG